MPAIAARVIKRFPEYVFAIDTAERREMVMAALREAITGSGEGASSNALAGEVLASSFWARPMKNWLGRAGNQPTILGAVSGAEGNTRVEVTVRPPLMPFAGAAFAMIVLAYLVTGLAPMHWPLASAAVAAGLLIGALNYLMEARRMRGVLEDVVCGTSWLSR